MRDITQAGDAVVAAKDGNVCGFTHVYLEGERACWSDRRDFLEPRSKRPRCKGDDLLVVAGL